MQAAILATILLTGTIDPVEVVRADTQLAMSIPIAHVDPKEDDRDGVELINRTEKEDKLGPFASGRQVGRDEMAFTPLGSGFQEPWMRDMRSRPYQPQNPVEPVSRFAIAAMIIILVLILVLIFVHIVIESRRHRKVEQAGERVRDQREADKERPAVEVTAKRFDYDRIVNSREDN